MKTISVKIDEGYHWKNGVMGDFNLILHIPWTLGNLYYDYVILFSKSEKEFKNRNTNTQPSKSVHKIYSIFWSIVDVFQGKM